MKPSKEFLEKLQVIHERTVKVQEKIDEAVALELGLPFNGRGWISPDGTFGPGAAELVIDHLGFKLSRNPITSICRVDVWPSRYWVPVETCLDRAEALIKEKGLWE